MSYTDLGCPTGPVLLLLPGMFASRFLGLPLHVLAEHTGVRLIVIDRPGIGGSTGVRVEERIDSWVDMLPMFLEQLGIEQVSLVSHSAGTVYLLNTLARCRRVVTRELFFLAPWVDPAHSHVTSMQMAQYLPTKVFSLWHHIPRFVVTQASPMLASSGAVMRGISSVSLPGTNNNTQAEEDKTFLDSNWRRIERDYGVPKEESAELSRLVVDALFKGETVGANDEALVCLKKGEAGSNWGACSDYRTCVRELGAREHAAGGELVVRVYFAEKDAMVGYKGQKYFEECWRAEGLQGIDFRSVVVKGTDHDTVSQAVEVWEEILRAVKNANIL
ncbi:alpha/beta fold hydrolase [Aspergillus mulundensis]|uniref:AB hydrolase-1 domain-containing protein n=1 Tax=Aspergillus mulundensis TaxID=1810919 RepID=A0A3D8T6K2_9EURO|nr:Uncharacterized protein DSM5745_01497 [Aspergillus mulundensis]RDW94175.1 Uncharacterized protein DSM5745_01497 [Aspergillus mulundensis]